MRHFRYLLVAILLGPIWPAAHGQTLGQVLRAIQNRKQLLKESESNSGATTNQIQLIQWKGGLSDFPLDNNVDDLSISDKLKVMKQAKQELAKFGFYDPRKLKDGFGTLDKLAFDPIERIDLTNFSAIAQRMGRQLQQMKILDWSIKWKYHSNSVEASPPDHSENPYFTIQTDPWPLTSTSHVLQGEETSSLNSAYRPYTCSGATWVPRQDFDVENVPDIPAHASWNSVWASDLRLEGKGFSKFASHVQIYSNFGFGTLAFDNDGFRYPKAQEKIHSPSVQLWQDYSASPDLKTLGSPSGFLGGDGSGFSAHDIWSSAGIPNYDNIGYPILGGTNIRYNWYWHEWDFAWRSFLNVDFSSEFQIVKRRPEQAPPIELISELDRGRLRVRLASQPESECNLIWRFPGAITKHGTDEQTTVWGTGALGSRGNLDVVGSGEWDAVYSGKEEDRGPLVTGDWASNSSGSYKRWKCFRLLSPDSMTTLTQPSTAYVSEWWRPVLVQLVCATYGVNVTRDGQFKYHVDFYRRDQVGAKDATTGRYAFNGAALKTITVENPAADEDTPTLLKVTVHDPDIAGDFIYDLQLDQQSYLFWTLNASAGSKTFLHQTVKVSYLANGPSTSLGGPTIETETKIDGVDLPKTTVKYSESVDPSTIQELKEEGTDGTRTTTYTYDWEEDEQGYSHIDHLTKIEQTGGINPYTADYDDAEQITHYVSGPWDIAWNYSGQTVTRATKLNGATVRTEATAYSGDMTRAETKVYKQAQNDTAGALPAIEQYYPGTDPVNPWGLKLTRGYDGATAAYSYAWDGNDFATTVLSRGGNGIDSESVTAGTKSVTKTNPAGKTTSWELIDLPSHQKLDFAAATAFQSGAPLFPATYSRPWGRTESYTYDGQGRVTSQTDIWGKTTSCTARDALGRLTQATRAGANGTLTWDIAYDSGLPAGHTGCRVTSSGGGTGSRSWTQSASPFGQTARLAITGPENATLTRTETPNSLGTVIENATTHRTLTQTVAKSNLHTVVKGNAVQLTSDAAEQWNLDYTPAAGQWTTANSKIGPLTETVTLDPAGRVIQREGPGGGGGTAATAYGYTNGVLTSLTPPSGQAAAFAYAPEGGVSGVTRGARFTSVARVGNDLAWRATASGADGTEILWERSYDPATGAVTETPRGLAARAITTTPAISGDELTLLTTGPARARTLKWKDGAFLSGTITEGSVVTGLAATANAYGEAASLTVKPGTGAGGITTSYDELGLPSGQSAYGGMDAVSGAGTGYDSYGSLVLQASRGGGGIESRTISAAGLLLSASGPGQVDQTWSMLTASGNGVRRTLSTSVGSAPYTWHGAGPLAARGFPDGTSESFGYTAAGAPSTITTPGGTLNLLPNPFGERTAIPGGSLDWNDAGLPSNAIDAAGAHALTYLEGQPRRDSHAGGPLSGQWIERAYDGQGQLAQTKLSGGAMIGTTATPAGEITSLVTAGGQAAAFANYDAVAGRPKDFTLGSLGSTTVYDAWGRVTSVTSKINGTAIATYGYAYDGRGRVSSQTQTVGGTTATITYGYDGKNQLTSASGGQTYGYGWDGAGRISGQSAANDYRATGRTNPQTVNLSGTLTATTGSATATSQINGGALGTIRVRAGKLLSTDYYDLSGWQTFTITATVAGAGMGGSDAVTQEVRQIFVPPASEALGYDLSGNRATDAQWTYTWNTGQQLARAVENGSAPGALPMQIDYVYDWLGRRVEKKVSSKAANGTLTQIRRLTWLYDGWLPVREIEYTASDLEKVRRTFTWGPDFTGRRGQEGAGVGGLVEIYEQPRFGTATRTLPYYDCNQNVVGAVDGATGAIVAQFSYGPFGEPISASGSRVDSVKFRFQTRYWDEETSTYNFCFRTLDPKTGFLSRDPLREKSGDVNDRRYCFNDPLRRHDPLGLQGWALKDDPIAPIGKVTADLGLPDAGFAHENYGFPLLVAEDREFAAELINYTPLAVLTGSAEAITGRNPITASRVTAAQAYGNMFLGALGVVPFGAAARLEGAELRTVLPFGRSYGATNLARSPIDALLPARIAKGIATPFESMLAKVDTLDFSTPANKAIFYSGPGQGLRATAFAERTGGMTIEMTLGGRALAADPVFQSLAPAEQFRIWQSASSPFANGASGGINAFIRGARADRTFRTIEEPLLNANPNVFKSTFHY